MNKKIFIIFTFVLAIVFNISKVEASQKIDAKITGIDIYVEEDGAKFKIMPLTEFQEDKIDSNYYSITYGVSAENCELINCFIATTRRLPYQSIISAPEIIEDKTTFYAGEDKFKVMVPKENANDEFLGEAEIYIRYKVENEEEIKTVSDNLYMDTRKASLEINVIDEENLEKIPKVKLKIYSYEQNITEEYISNSEGKIFIDRIGKGQTELRIIGVPEEYKTLEEQYIEILYGEKNTYTMELEHKKGSLYIETLPEAEFEIYNIDNDFTRKVITDENGKINIEKINTGSYVLKQTKVKEGYEKMKDLPFEIVENGTYKIAVINKEIPKEPVNNIEPPKEEKTEDIIKEETPNNNKENINNDKEAGTEKTDDSIESTKPNLEDEKKENVVNKVTENLEKKEETNDTEKTETQEEKSDITIQRNNTLRKQSQAKLPRTGNDYFEIKLISFNILIYSVYLVIVFLKKKKTDHKNSLSIQIKL